MTDIPITCNITVWLLGKFKDLISYILFLSDRAEAKGLYLYKDVSSLWIKINKKKPNSRHRERREEDKTEEMKSLLGTNFI